MHDASFARQLRQHRLSRGLTQEQLAERARLSARAVSDLELGELQRLLQAKPLITLVGPGGVGKTRLALEVATRFAPSAAGGVRLVELASLSEAELLAERLAAALGIVERTEGSLLTTLLHSLRHAHLLLVFDNCEHVVEACAKLTELGQPTGLADGPRDPGMPQGRRIHPRSCQSLWRSSEHNLEDH